MAKIAVIRTGGKQYKVQKDDVLKVEKLEGEKNKEIVLKDVLLVADSKKVDIGQPKVSGASVKAKILEQGRDKKVKVVKYKAKIRYKKTYGHRQHFTKLKIGAIE